MLVKATDLVVLNKDKYSYQFNQQEMEKVPRPERLDVSPNTVDAPRAWRHWLATFKNFIESLQRPDENLDKLRILINFVTPKIYELFSDSNNYDKAIAKLKAAYVKTPNEIFARHTLSS